MACFDSFSEFSEWIDRVIQNGFPQNAKALCFNLYENDVYYSVQLVASSYYDENDSDWPCHEVFSTGEDLFQLKRTEEICDWVNGLEIAADIVYDYLRDGTNKDKLTSFEAVAIGFVDGDLIPLYANQKIYWTAIKDYVATLS